MRPCSRSDALLAVLSALPDRHWLASELGVSIGNVDSAAVSCALARLRARGLVESRPSSKRGSGRRLDWRLVPRDGRAAP